MEVDDYRVGVPENLREGLGENREQRDKCLESHSLLSKYLCAMIKINSLKFISVLFCLLLSFDIL